MYSIGLMCIVMKLYCCQTDLIAQGLGIEYIILEASDPDKAAFTWAMHRHGGKIKHWYNDLRSHPDCECYVCGESFENCTRPSSRRDPIADFRISGMNCKPVSIQRGAARWREGGVENHNESYIYSAQVEEMHRRVTKIVILEEVEGFDRPMSSSSQNTPLQKLLEDVQERGIYHMGVFKLDSCAFWEASRVRIFVSIELPLPYNHMFFRIDTHDT